VGHGNTVKWEGLGLQLPPSRLRPHFYDAKGGGLVPPARIAT
jgi:hypothetical protein